MLDPCKCRFCVKYRDDLYVRPILEGRVSIHLTWWQKIKRFFS